MGPKSRSAERRSRACGLDLVAIRSEIVALKGCLPYYQTPSRACLVSNRVGLGGAESAPFTRGRPHVSRFRAAASSVFEAFLPKKPSDGSSAYARENAKKV